LAKVCILGAGYMGSAFTFPLSTRGIEVNLWGTWLDDNILDACKKGEHPGLGKRLPPEVKLFYSDELSQALKGAVAVVVAVTSEGFLPVFNKALKFIKNTTTFFCLTKGLVEYRGSIERISEVARILLNEKLGEKVFLWASVGGPVKAMELAREIPTASIYGISHSEIIKFLKLFSTNYYRLYTTSDIIGVEISSCFKNIYSIGLGICDGYYKSSFPDNYHNYRALMFTQAVNEMGMIASLDGGSRETVFGLAGVGDLHVTSSSGRNRIFGEKVGKGMNPKQVYSMMLENEQVVEGYVAMDMGIEYIQKRSERLLRKLPLLLTLDRIVIQEKDVGEELKNFALLCGE